ncbi:hypothetical protein [Paraburkholderia caballeronis]|nr:hypothetical protein [Paraburkholderia caballeronis]
MNEERTLTDADVEALAAKLEENIARRLYLNVGKGVLAVAWKWVVLGVIMLGAYGAGGGFKKWGA